MNSIDNALQDVKIFKKNHGVVKITDVYTFMISGDFLLVTTKKTITESDFPFVENKTEVFNLNDINFYVTSHKTTKYDVTNQ